MFSQPSAERAFPELKLQDEFSDQSWLILALNNHILRCEKQNLESPSVLQKNAIEQIKDLKKMVLSAGWGQDFNNIINAWQKKWLSQSQNNNNHFRLKYFQRLNKLNLIPPSTDLSQMSVVYENLREHFGTVKLYLKIFNNDFSVNTENAIKLINLAGKSAEKVYLEQHKKQELFSSHDDSDVFLELSKMLQKLLPPQDDSDTDSFSASDIFKELSKLLDVFLNDLINSDLGTCDTILDNVNNWNALPELEKKYGGSDDKYYELNKCAQMQQYLINTVNEMKEKMACTAIPEAFHF